MPGVNDSEEGLLLICWVVRVLGGVAVHEVALISLGARRVPLVALGRLTITIHPPVRKMYPG